MPVQVCACPAMPVPTRVYSAMPVPVRAMPAPACPGLLHASSTRSRCLSQVMRCVFFQLPVSFRIRKTARACAEPAPGLLHASSNLRLLAPHEVGVCHRLCPVSFGNFLCLSEAVRALRVSFRGRAPSCLSEAEAADEAAHPRTRANTMRGPVSRPPLYPTNGPNVTACRTRSPKLRCLPTPSDAVACSTGS